MESQIILAPFAAAEGNFMLKCFFWQLLPDSDFTKVVAD
jgi:hypothetical protein